MRMLNLFLITFLILVALPVQSQVTETTHVAAFLDYTDDNYWLYLSDDEYEDMHPLDWSWFLGAMFNNEWETLPLEPDVITQHRKREYLRLLWQELLDYVHSTGVEFEARGINPDHMRLNLELGFLREEADEYLEPYMDKLKINSPTITTPLHYSDSLPEGGVMAHAFDYSQPWTQTNSAANSTVVHDDALKERMDKPGTGYSSGGFGRTPNLVGKWYAEVEGTDMATTLSLSATGQFDFYVSTNGNFYDRKDGAYVVTSQTIDFTNPDGSVDRVPYRMLSDTSFILDFSQWGGQTLTFVPLKTAPELLKK